MPASALKLHAVALILSLATLVAARAGAVEDANAAYQRGDYAAASRAYETAIAAGAPSAGLYYNLATSQIKEGQKAKAAVNLHRAILLDPQLGDARVSLSEIERSQGVPAQKPTWIDTLAEKAPLPLIAGLGSVVLWCGAFFIVFLIIRGKGNFGVLAMGLIIVLFGAAVLSTAIIADPRLSQQSGAIVVADKGAALLQAPADQSPTVVQLPPASLVLIIRKSGDWTYCQAPGGEKGWLPSASVERIVPSA